MANTERETAKTFLLGCIRKVNKLSNPSLKILCETPMSGLKLIERSSKCLKDPNPLASTMSCLSTKYPISVDKQKALQYGIPKSYWTINSRIMKDTHQHGRVLCKKEAVEWWINNSTLPNDDTLSVINILMKQHRQESKEYYSVNWRDSRISFGPPNLERKLVSTRNPVVNIEKPLREQAIKQTLMPQYTIPYSRITTDILSQLKDLTDTSLNSKIAIATQIRLIINNLDSRMRVLPIIPGSLDTMHPMKHALVHTNLVLANCTLPHCEKTLEMTKLLHHYSSVLIYSAVELKLTSEEITSIAKSTSINKIPLSSVLINSKLNDTNYIKWVKTSLSMPVTTENTKFGLTTSPEPANIRIEKMFNINGVGFLVYHGKELVNFKYKDMRGQFTHNGQNIINITTNYTTHQDLYSLIAEIAVYCRFGMEYTKARLPKHMFQEVRDTNYKKPHLALGCEPSKLSSLKVGRIYGALNLVVNSEYLPSQRLLLKIDNDYNLTGDSSNIRISIEKPQKPEPLPPSIKVLDRRIMDFFDFKRYVQQKTMYYMENANTIRNCIKKRDFCWGNKAMLKHWGINVGELSACCRLFLSNLVESNWVPEVACFYYNFTHANPTTVRGIHTYTSKGGFKIDIWGQEGILKYHKDQEKYTLFGDTFSRSSNVNDPDLIYNTILEGYYLLPSDTVNFPVRSMAWLENNRHDMPEGQQFSTYISGRIYTAVCSRKIKHQQYQTVHRQLEARHLWMENLNVVGGLLPRKRKISEVSLDSDDQLQSGSKIPKGDDDENIGFIEEDFEDEDLIMEL